MNYEKIYADFIIDRRRGERLLRDLNQIVERHHIIPKSLNGNDSPENLIDLTPGDHYFAHLCLAKIHGGNQWLAVNFMNQFSKRKIQPRHWYEYAARKTRPLAGKTGKDHPTFGRRGKDCPASRLIGEKNGMYGRKHTEEAKVKMGAAARGHKHTTEIRAQMSRLRRGRKPTKETKMKMSLAALDIWGLRKQAKFIRGANDSQKGS